MCLIATAVTGHLAGVTLTTQIPLLYCCPAWDLSSQACFGAYAVPAACCLFIGAPHCPGLDWTPYHSPFLGTDQRTRSSPGLQAQRPSLGSQYARKPGFGTDTGDGVLPVGRRSLYAHGQNIHVTVRRTTPHIAP